MFMLRVNLENPVSATSPLTIRVTKFKKKKKLWRAQQYKSARVRELTGSAAESFSTLLESKPGQQTHCYLP